MSNPRNHEYVAELVRELARLPAETEWVEFKVNKAVPKDIGRAISALANAAVLAERRRAYLVWGVEDGAHRIVGTTFDPRSARKGNEPLESWLPRLLTPPVNFRFREGMLTGNRVVVLEIPPAQREPVSFEGVEYVRVGASTRRLRSFREKRMALWAALSLAPWELSMAAERVTGRDVVQILDYPQYFHLLKQPLPEARRGVLAALEADDLIQRCDAGRFDVTNRAAILLARDLRHFGRLQLKAVRVIHYRGSSRLEANGEREPMCGYASGFSSLEDHVDARLPTREVFDGVFRRSRPSFPMPAVRELIANALIHQDFRASGPPRIEIFEGRVEITNPGTSLVDPRRVLDLPPRTRNEKLASLMRRFGLSEERGVGIDKVVAELERHQLPAPLFENAGESTRVTLFGPRPLRDMTREERLRAIYLHASLRFVSGGAVTNASLRARFGIPAARRSAVSRHIREAVDAGVIQVKDPRAGLRARAYVPWWASVA